MIVCGFSADELAAIERLDSAVRARAIGVYVGSGDPDTIPPVAGTTTIADKCIHFEPRHGFEMHTDYRVIVRPARFSDNASDTSDAIIFRFQAESFREIDETQTEIEHIYPSADRLPENQLRFYIHFTQPMGRGQAYQHIHLFDADDKLVEGALLELGEELWDRDMRRFTLLFDPAAREARPEAARGAGPGAARRTPLHADDRRRLARRAGQAAGGRGEQDVHRRAAGRAPLDPAQWKIEPPPAGGNAVLVVRFPTPLDRAMLERVMWVVEPRGARVPGAIEVADEERHVAVQAARGLAAGRVSPGGRNDARRHGRQFDRPRVRCRCLRAGRQEDRNRNDLAAIRGARGGEKQRLEMTGLPRAPI